MIPKIIHQIWIGPKPIPWTCIDSWKDKHPTWEHKLWTEKELEPIKNLKQYNATPNLSGKSNVLRYEILYKYGGLYVDADSVCLKPIDALTDHPCVVSYENERQRPDLLCSWPIFITPEHRLMEECIQRIGLLLEETCRTEPSWKVTGPRLLTNAVKMLENRVDIRKLPSHLFFPLHHTGQECDATRREESYCEHLWESTPGVPQNVREKRAQYAT